MSERTQTLTGTTSSETTVRPTEAARAALALTIIDHPDGALIGACELLTARSRLVLGRGAAEAFPGVFAHGKVSREHAAIEIGDDDEVTLHDLGSHNGTFVNELRIGSQSLVRGDVVRIGEALMLLHRRLVMAPRARHASIVGVSTALGQVLREVGQVARHTTTVAIIGETGTGKEVIANELHRSSGRSGPLVALNCGGISETLVASELFGHVRGAFTGADRRRSGLIETARGGTLFLDEIMDAPAGLQATFLRLFETGEYRAVGSDVTEKADVRFVVAAQPEIEERIEDRRFRLDLWTRLARWVIRIPPLRERPEDIAPLARHFAERYAGSPVRLAPSLVVALTRHAWPGNVRELQGMVERLVIAARRDGAHEVLELGLDASVREQLMSVRSEPEPRPASAPPLVPMGAPVPAPPAPPLARRGAKPTRAEIEQALAAQSGNVRATALALGIGRKTLYRWVEAQGIDVGAIRDGGEDEP